MKQDKADCALELKRLQEQVEVLSGTAQSAPQPYSYLFTRLQDKQSAIQDLNAQVRHLQGLLDDLRAENADLHRVRNVMAADLEHLLQSREDLVEVKQEENERRIEEESKN